MTLPALKGVSSFCKVWILCGSIPQTNKALPGSSALKLARESVQRVWTRLRINYVTSPYLIIKDRMNTPIMPQIPSMRVAVVWVL
jgi:hypothetical protein